MKNRCRMFPNCRRIADKMNIPVNWLYTYIRGYNEYARQNKLETISASKAYSQDELDDIQSKIEAYQKQKLNDESERRKDFSRMAKSFGSSNAYASYVLHQSGLSGEQISSVSNEIYRTFVYICDQIADRTEEKSFDLVVKKFGVTKLLGKVKEMMETQSISNADNKALYDDNPSLRASISDDDYNRLSESLDIANKLFARTGYENEESLPDFFYEASVLALPMINTVLANKINEDFVFVKNDAKNQEDVENVYDLEEPTVEHWQDVIDKMCPETSISNIIKRILMNTEKQVVKNTVKYYLNDNEIDASEITKENKNKVKSSLISETVTPKTPIMGLPYTNNPAALARNLFKILENCSSESSMMNLLSRHNEFSQLYNILESDSRLRTTFFANFNKYSMKMSKTSSVRLSDGTYSISDIPLNSHTAKDRLLGYISKLRLKKVSNNSIYHQQVNTVDDNKDVVAGRSNKISASYAKFVTAKDRLEILKNIPYEKENRTSAINNICFILDALNLNADLSIANSIYDSIAVYRDFINNVSLFFELAQKEFFNYPNNTSKNVTQVLSTNREVRNVLDNILKIANPYDVTDMSGSNTAEFAGNRISTRIQPSAITNLIKKFKDCTYEEFMSWLNVEYLNSNQFVENPLDENSRIWNRWLSDMVKEANTSLGAGGFKDIFNISRNLGFNDTKFEKISDRDHMLSILYGYLRNRVKLEDNTELAKEINGSLYVLNLETNKYDIEVPEQKRKGRKFLMLEDTIIRKYDNTVGKNGKIAFTEFKRKDVATIPMFITGDTNSLRQFKTIHYYEDEIIDGIYGLYRSDLNTQKVVNEFNNRGFMVSSNGKETFTKFINKFGILTFLNQSKWKEKLDSITTSDGLAVEDNFKQLVKEYLDEEFEKFYNVTLENLGILQKDQNGKYIYFNDYLNNDDKELELRNNLKDFFYNYKFGLYNQTNLQHVTTLFFNGVEDHQKRNKGQGTTGTSLSFEAEIDGEKLWDSTNFAEKVVYFKDVKNSISDEEAKTISNFIIKTFTPLIGESKAKAKAKSLVKVYKSNSLTDGQGIRSIESYRRVLASAGENFWTREQELAYQKIQSIITPAREQNRNLTANEIQTIENMLVVMQPIKPINDGIETFQIGSTVAKMGFQLKYAEVPLIPEMYPVGSRLRQIGDWMRSANVDMICSDKCLKKGSFGEVDIQYKAKNGVYVDSNDRVLPGMDVNGNEVTKATHGRGPTMAEQRRYITNTGKDGRIEYDGNISFAEIIQNQSITDVEGNELNYVIHNIPMDNYLIQNNIPDHSNGNVVVGTQQRKLIGSMIYDGVEYNIAGKKISGDKLHKIYNALHTAKYFKSYKKFLSIINDPQALSKNLAFSVAQSNRGSLNLLDKIAIDEDGNPMIPYSELGNGKEITNNLISIFKRFVIRQQVSGGNIVQATAMGIGEVLSDPTLNSIYDNNGVEIGIEVEMPFFFEVNIDGVPVKLKYEKYCNNDGTFKEGTNGGTLIEEDYPGILDMEIHRIPTEGGYSMCRAHIKRCSPKTAANTMKRPAKLTSRFDDDFDIDKMFFSRKSFRYTAKRKANEDRSDFERDVWDRIYNENPTIMAKLLWAAGRSDKAIKGVNRATRKQEEKLAEEYNTTVDKLHLNYYWDIAHITTDKDELFSKYAEDQLAKKSNEQISRELEIEKDFDFESDDSSLLDLSTSQIDNAIFEINKAVLSDESTMAERITPGGFADMSENARVIRCLRNKELIPEWKDRQLSTEEDFNEFVSYIKEHSELDFKQEYDYSDPETLILFKQWNQVAGEEIGIFANDNVNDAISRALSKFSIKKKSDSILFGSLSQQIADIDGKYGLNENIGLDFLFKTVNGRSVPKTLHELLGSSVDAVKDNALIDINLNSVTGDAGAMLVRLGYSTLDIGLLFNQPIVKDTLLYMSRSGERNISNALKIVLESNKYNVKVKYNTLSKPYSKNNVSSSKLARNIYGENIDVNSQLDVAKLINKIMTIQMEVSRYVQDTRNTSANKTKTDFGEFFSSSFKSIINQIEGFDMIDIRSSENLEYPMTEEAVLEGWDTTDNNQSDEMIRQFMDKYKDHPFQYENAVYNIIKAAMLRIAHKATPYLSVNYENYRRRLNNFMSPRGVKGEVINALHDFIPAISLVRRNGDFNPDARTNPMGIPNKEYYLKTFVNWFAAIRDDRSEYFDEDVYFALLTNPFLDILDFSYIGGKKNRDVGAEIFYLKTSKDADKYEKWGYSLGWDDLMNSDNPNLRRLGHDLYMYFYYINGLNPRYNWAMELAPVSVLDTLVADKIGDTNITYPQIFDEKVNEEQITDDIIRKDLIKFLIYNSNDENIVPRMPFKLSDVKSGNDDDTIIIRKELIHNVRLGMYRSDNFITDKNKMFVRPIIKVDGALYILGTSNDFDRAINNVVDKSTQTLVYKRIEPNFDKESDFSEYYWERNNYIFGAFKNDIITDEKIVQSDNYDVDDNDDTPDAVIAANEADDDSKVKALNEDGEEVENCGD